MPVTLIGSKWSSGTLIFYTKSTGAAVLTLTTTSVTITPATTITGQLTLGGVLKFGTYTAGVATDSTGYVTITDAGGTARKLMVQA